MDAIRERSIDVCAIDPPRPRRFLRATTLGGKFEAKTRNDGFVRRRDIGSVAGNTASRETPRRGKHRVDLGPPISIGTALYGHRSLPATLAPHSKNLAEPSTRRQSTARAPQRPRHETPEWASSANSATPAPSPTCALEPTGPSAAKTLSTTIGEISTTESSGLRDPSKYSPERRERPTSSELAPRKRRGSTLSSSLPRRGAPDSDRAG
jgi:hypothetical protein